MRDAIRRRFGRCVRCRLHGRTAVTHFEVKLPGGVISGDWRLCPPCLPAAAGDFNRSVTAMWPGQLGPCNNRWQPAMGPTTYSCKLRTLHVGDHEDGQASWRHPTPIVESTWPPRFFADHDPYSWGLQSPRRRS
jgi:hypothetical protein